MRQVLVTGGGWGIGRTIARGFAAKDAAVTITGRRMDAQEETAQGMEMTCRTADVTDEASVDALFDHAHDVVVANAGTGTPALVKDTTLDDWNAQVAVNLTGPFLTFRGALQRMERGGRLIAVASTASLMGQAYAAAKHGVLGLVRSLAHEVAKDGITCSAVCPYFVETPLTDSSAANVSKRLGVSDKEARAILAKRNPVGRLISADEVTSGVLYLASPGAAMINGHALSVSGGRI